MSRKKFARPLRGDIDVFACIQPCLSPGRGFGAVVLGSPRIPARHRPRIARRCPHRRRYRQHRFAVAWPSHPLLFRSRSVQQTNRLLPVVPRGQTEFVQYGLSALAVGLAIACIDHPKVTPISSCVPTQFSWPVLTESGYILSVSAASPRVTFCRAGAIRLLARGLAPAYTYNVCPPNAGSRQEI